jgi:hypothetical protein
VEGQTHLLLAASHVVFGESQEQLLVSHSPQAPPEEQVAVHSLEAVPLVYPKFMHALVHTHAPLLQSPHVPSFHVAVTLLQVGILVCVPLLLHPHAWLVSGFFVS